MIDTYIKSQSREELLSLRAFLKNVMEPVPGRDATQETTDEDGNIIPAQEALGDPDYFYTCVRASFPVPAFGGISPIDPVLGQQLCGVWA